MDAAEYKHTVLGLIFLKYISDSFEEHHAKLLQGSAESAMPIIVVMLVTRTLW
jgi:type I restriction enzyme M protein